MLKCAYHFSSTTHIRSDMITIIFLEIYTIYLPCFNLNYCVIIQLYLWIVLHFTVTLI